MPLHNLTSVTLAVAKDPDAPRRGDPGYFESLPDRQSRGPGAYPSREEIPIPSRPPYTAYVGNLAFDAVEEDIEMFFQGAATKSIKVIRDMEGKPKGFGYVEFDSVDGLKEALSRTGESFGGRQVRISVAEPRKYHEFLCWSSLIPRSQGIRWTRRIQRRALCGRHRNPMASCRSLAIPRGTRTTKHWKPIR
jgi:RNA recognition motif-containing protein